MIIFDLDGSLASCEHRRHFVDPKYHKDYTFMEADMMTRMSSGYFKKREGTSGYIKFIPNWKAFYEDCDKDEPIKPVIHLLEYIGESQEYGCDTPWVTYENIEIWSGRCESVRSKTEKWLETHLRHYHKNSPTLKMRPIGDSTPDDQLKERWLDEHIAGGGKPIDMVFDDRANVISMWQRRGVFVFDVSQGKGDF